MKLTIDSLCDSHLALDFILPVLDGAARSDFQKNAQSDEQIIRLSLPSSMALVPVVDAVISELVEQMAFDSETREQVILAVIEAGTNAIKHGNRNQPHQFAHFEFICAPDRLTVVVGDKGKGFEPEQVPSPLADENRFKTGGRGIFLIRGCMDVVSYEAGGTIVRMTKYTKEAPAAAA
ncbi:MAG: ATP-binding protein [Candidatus Poribacteria bacterium]|nr:ATP-binding protein [Candidatus Poribacteria bacterium]